ncbi:hypothetical protein HYY69_01390 [Candidatus Woesearchaeota archaeon]|nr:hypothetical protein [Candidatus Woesearchaeota archaeon]
MVQEHHQYDFGHLIECETTLDEKVRFAPNVIIIGGGRCTGKTTTIDHLLALQDQKRVQDVEFSVTFLRSHASREKRPNEVLHRKRRTHDSKPRDILQDGITKGSYYLAYELGENLYAFPPPGDRIKRRAFSPLKRLEPNYKSLVKPDDIRTRVFAPLYVCQTTCPDAFLRLREIFPNGVYVITGLDETNADQIDRRVEKRIRDTLSGQQLRRRDLTRDKFDKLVENEAERVRALNSKFMELSSTYADIVLDTSNPIDPSSRFYTQAVYETGYRNASRTALYAQRHIFDFMINNQQKPDPRNIHENFVADKLERLFGQNLPDILNKLTQFKPLLIRDQDGLRQLLEREKITYEGFKRTYNGIDFVVFKRQDGDTIIGFKYLGSGPRTQDSFLNFQEQTLLKIVLGILGNAYEEQQQNRGIRYSLSDKPGTPGLVMRFYQDLDDALKRGTTSSYDKNGS